MKPNKERMHDQFGILQVIEKWRQEGLGMSLFQSSPADPLQ